MQTCRIPEQAFGSYHQDTIYSGSWDMPGCTVGFAIQVFHVVSPVLADVLFRVVLGLRLTSRDYFLNKMQAIKVSPENI